MSITISGDGDINATGNDIELNSTGTTDVTLAVGGGSVGVGVASPTATLDVNGTIKLDGNYPVGTSNVALGDTALDDASFSGANNVAVGHAAMSATTSGNFNSAVGAYSLSSNTTGSSNASSGSGALENNSTGSSNSALGAGALTANTTASNNTAVGKDAGGLNSTGENNTFLGKGAGYSSTSSYNTYVGHDAGLLVTTGSKNTILGRYNGNQGGLDIRTSSNNIVLSDGDGNPRVSINQDGAAKIVGSNGSAVNRAGNYHEIVHNNNDTPCLIISEQHGSFVQDVLQMRCAKSNASNWWFMNCYSSGTSDTEFLLRGDGQAYADGSWNGGGADYAEYFEWVDGNTTNEDRRGYSVVLENNKMRKATADDDATLIFGVISARPSMIGDADVGTWKSKYLKDDFGAYIRDENDERVLNPDYDPDQKYTSREDRPEWDAVGLMGKLRIRKGQPTGSNWIKMRDVSDTVEEWLVR